MSGRARRQGRARHRRRDAASAARSRSASPPRARVVHLNDLEDPARRLAELPESGRGLALALRRLETPAQIRTTFARLDRLDVLVNCAGITGWMNLADPSEEIWDRVIDTNLKGTFFCSVEAARLMRAGGGGSIVNVSSVVAARGLRNLAAYAASKGGINALTIQLAVRARARPDPRQRLRARRDERRAQPRRRPVVSSRRWAPLIPLGRVAEPEDMVGPTVFLASDESSHVTGQVFYVDGGWTVGGQGSREVRRPRGTQQHRER